MKKDLTIFKQEFNQWKEKIDKAIKKHKTNSWFSENEIVFDDLLNIDYCINCENKSIEDIFEENPYMYNNIDAIIRLMNNCAYMIAYTMLVDTVDSFENGDYEPIDDSKLEYFILK